jgi:hypothetical protein
VFAARRMSDLISRVRRLEQGPQREVIVLRLNDGNCYRFFGTTGDFLLAGFAQLRKGVGPLIAACRQTVSFEPSGERLIEYIVEMSKGNSCATLNLLTGAPLKAQQESAEKTEGEDGLARQN